MFHQHESNPHFLPHHNNDPVIELPSRTQPPPRRSRPAPPHHHSRTSVEPPHHHSRTSVEPPPGPRPHAPAPQSKPHPKPLPPHQVETPPRQQQEPQPTLAPEPYPHPHSERGHHQHHHSPYLHGPTSQPTRPIAWLVAAFCALFWIIVIVGGLIILIVYLVFRPRNPRFDISTATINAAYLDMGYLLNADVTVLANFTNPNTKVNVDFSYIVLDLYYDKNVIATRYVEPFSVMKRESRFVDVHMVSSQVRLSMGQSLELQKQIEEGRIKFEIRGLFRTKSKLGGIFRYSYWLYAHCQIVVTGPPTGVSIQKHCVTKR